MTKYGTLSRITYKEAKPLVNLSSLARVLNRLQRNGYEIAVISWLAKNSNAEYDEMVTKAKMEWLENHLPSVKWDKISIVALQITLMLYLTNITIQLLENTLQLLLRKKL